jgi:hypothetical protein
LNGHTIKLFKAYRLPGTADVFAGRFSTARIANKNLHAFAL